MNRRGAARTVAYIHNSAQIGGGNKQLLGLIDHLDRGTFRPISVLPDGGPMEGELRRRGVRCHVVPLERALAATSCLGALAAVASLTRIFLLERPAVVHSNSVRMFRYVGALTARTGAAPICHIHHPGEAGGSLRWAFRTRPDIVVVPSQAMHAEVSAELAAAGMSTRVVTVLNAVDTDRFVPAADRIALRARLGLAHCSHVVSILGLVSERKGHPLFLRMAAHLRDRFPRAAFLVIGEDILYGGEYRRRMEAFARELGVASQVTFFGFAPDALARDLVAASDLMVLPTNEEGFGLSLAEAQAAGVPVIATDVGPIREVIADGETGVVVRQDDVDALHAAAARLLLDEPMRRQMGTAGRARAVARFSLPRYAREIEAVYGRARASARPTRDCAV